MLLYPPFEVPVGSDHLQEEMVLRDSAIFVSTKASISELDWGPTAAIFLCHCQCFIWRRFMMLSID